MKYGTRTPFTTNINNILKQFTYDTDLHIYKISLSYNKPIAYFNQWKFLVLNELLNKLKQKSSSIVSYSKVNLFKHIKILKGQFVITYTDKSPNKYAIMYKEYHNDHLSTIISSNNNSKISNEPSVVRNRQIYNYHKLLNIPSTNFN